MKKALFCEALKYCEKAITVGASMTKRKSGRDFRRMAIRTTLLITLVNIAAGFLDIDCGIVLMPATILAILLGIFVIASTITEKVRAVFHSRRAYQITRP